MQKIGIISYGLGPIGKGIAKVALQRENLKFIGGVDINPEYHEKDVGEVLGIEPFGSLIKSKIKDLSYKEAQVVLHSTQSSLPKIYDQIEEIAKLGLNIISTTEELSYPFIKYPELSKKIDLLAKENNISILGTGVNPGFLMDSFPLFFTSVFNKVKKIRILRLMDASKRRGPFQIKIGSGLSVDQFKTLVKEGKLGHVGLQESIQFIATSLGMEISEYKETINPVLADEKIKTEYVEVEAGKVRGIDQVGIAYDKTGNELIKLEFNAYLNAENPHDIYEIEGDPNLSLIIPGGIPGDIATSSIAINAIPRVIASPPGLITMKDIPLTHNFGSF